MWCSMSTASRSACLELKRSTMSVAEGIRQNLDNQKKDLHRALLLHHAAAHGRQRHRGPALRQRSRRRRSITSTWKEDSPVENLLDRALIQLCGKARFLELIHDFIVFDAGIKKTLPPQPVFRRARRAGRM